MAAIGDVLVKFVADFAEFSTGLKAGQKELTDFATKATETGKAIEGFMGAAKAVFGTAIVTAAVAELKKFAEQTIQNAIEIDKLAAKYKLTTDQVQGLQAQAKATGEDFNKLADYYKNHGDQLAKITDAAKTTAQVMQGDLVKAIGNFADAADDAFIKAKWMFQSGGSGPANAINAAAGAVKNLGDSLAYIDGKQAAMAFVIAVATGNFAVFAGGIVGAATNPAGAGTMATAEKQLSEANANLQKVRDMVAEGTLVAKDLQKAEQDVVVAADNLKNARDKARQQADQNAKLADAKKTLQNDPITVTATGGGGGGAAGDDSIDKQIARYKAMGAAADEASKKISAGYDQNIEDLLRQVKAQQTAADIVAKLEANHQVVSKEQKKLLEDTVLATENKIAAEQKLIAVENQAAETDKKYGDGTVALTKLHKDIAAQLNTRRINETEAARATKEGTEAIEQAALAAKRYDDNLGSLAAGFAQAANAYARQNDLFSQGQQIFGGLTSAMTEGLKALEGQSSKTFGQIALDFANMLADMAVRAAVSQVFKTVFGALGGGVTAAAVPAGGFNAGIGADGLGWLTPRAGGGPVSAGQSYVVGEQGPELFVPTAAGNIVPSGAAAGGGNGSNVTVNVDMNTTQGAADPAKMLQFGRQMKAAIKDVIQNERRPGGSLYSRVSA
jgi:hypothetical protein